MSSKSRFERRAARQRQLDMMEAEASGTAIGLNLDQPTVVESEGRFVSIRQRNQETARRFLYDEDEALAQQQGTGGSTRNTTSTGGFATRASAGTAVNLMDHETGVYTEQDNSSTLGRLGRFLFGPGGGSVAGTGTVTTSTDHHDAIAADSDVYFGDQRATRSASVCGPICGRLRYLFFASKNRFLAILVLFVGVFIVVFYTLRMMGAGESESPELILRSQNSERFNQIMDHIVLQGIANPKTFLVATSPQARALRWLAYSDKARLDPDNAMILQRYALAVFFYDSYMFFEKFAGRQKPIENEDEQFEGVPVSGWTLQDGWLSKQGYCSWYGVECEVRSVNGVEMRTYDDNAPVHALNLGQNYVWGTIPFELKALHSLERIDFSKNRLSGKFPSIVENLPRLKYLYLSQNRMVGELPREIGSMQSIVELRLNQNKFTGSVPTELNRLSNLHVLDMSENLFSSQFPSVRSLSNLKNLHLNSNELSGTVPFSVAELHELREIYLEKNRLKGTLAPEMESLSNLRIFSVHDNLISGPLPNGLFKYNKQLEHVRVNNNKFSGALPSGVGQLVNLQTLDMQNNLLTGSFPTEWTNMPSLQVIHLQNNQMKGNIPSTIGALKSVKELWLASNSISGPIPPALGDCASLEFVYLENNKLTGQIPTELGSMKKLETIRLEQNSLTGFVPQQICNLKTFDGLGFISADCSPGSSVECECCSKCF